MVNLGETQEFNEAYCMPCIYFNHFSPEQHVKESSNVVICLKDVSINDRKIFLLLPLLLFDLPAPYKIDNLQIRKRLKKEMSRMGT